MASKLFPAQFRTVQDAIVILNIANRVNADPVLVANRIYEVHGKYAMDAQFVIAALNSCGRFSPLRFVFEGDGDDYGCHAWAYDRSDREKLVGPKVDLRMVKAEKWDARTGTKWKTMPQVMFHYRAAAFFGRIYAPDILMGMQTADEVADVYGAMPETHKAMTATDPAAVDAALLGHETPTDQAKPPQFDPDTGELLPAELQ